MKIFIITLFPDIIQIYLQSSMMKKAQDAGAASFSIIPLRPFGLGKHKQVDDYPYGGGPGMLLRPEPIFEAVESVSNALGKKPWTILLTPKGKKLTQTKAKRLAKREALLFICGHYEGVDERVRAGLADEEISIGDYVLTGGELPALVITDAVVRLLENVLPPESRDNESFQNNRLEHPQFTRPADFRSMKVPDVLVSGNHAAIEKWRKENSPKRTGNRP